MSANVPSQALRAQALILQHLGARVVGVWLHGSAVAGGLRPDSDLDLLAAIRGPVPDDARRPLLAGLMALSGGGPRPLEVIVIDLAEPAALAFPSRSEFTFGEWLRDSFQAGAQPRPHRDPEYTVLLAQARQAALALSGPPAVRVLPAVPPRDLRRALAACIPALVAALPGDARNVLLTLARIWHTHETGGFAPKDRAALWACARLPPAQALVLDQARRAYLGQAPDAPPEAAAALARSLAARLA